MLHTVRSRWTNYGSNAEPHQLLVSFFKRFLLRIPLMTDMFTPRSHGKEDPLVDIDFIPFHEQPQSICVYSDMYRDNEEAKGTVRGDRGFFVAEPLPR